MSEETPLNEREPQPLEYAGRPLPASGFTFSWSHRSPLEQAFWVGLFVLVGGCFALMVWRWSIPCDYSLSNIDLTKQLVSSRGALDTQITIYQQNTGQYPATLNDLTTRPADPAVATKWGDEPYIKKADSMRDAWGNPLQYRAPGVHNPAGFDLWSVGPDGVNGTADDIGNW